MIVDKWERFSATLRIPFHKVRLARGFSQSWRGNTVDLLKIGLAVNNWLSSGRSEHLVSCVFTMNRIVMAQWKCRSRAPWLDIQGSHSRLISSAGGHVSFSLSQSRVSPEPAGMRPMASWPVEVRRSVDSRIIQTQGSCAGYGRTTRRSINKLYLFSACHFICLENVKYTR